MADRRSRAQARQHRERRSDGVPSDDGPAATTSKAISFSFGDPEPVLSRAVVLEHIECWRNGDWYEPPISLAGLARTRFASPHHASAMAFKGKQLAKLFVPHPMLDAATFQAWVMDYLALGNGYLEQILNRAGRPLRLKRALAKYARVGVEPGRHFYLNGDGGHGLSRIHAFEPGSVFHLAEPDLNQEIYGVPAYLGALQSAFLNEAATLFRRRYYANGSHAGYILYSTDAQLEQGDVNALRQALKDSKGPGNFRNMFLHAPGGRDKGLQLIPISEVTAKDEFLGIKNTSRDDVLAAHRVPPQLLGVVPQTAGGFGDVAKAADVFHALEIEPLMAETMQLNDWVGQEVVRYRERVPLMAAAG